MAQAPPSLPPNFPDNFPEPNPENFPNPALPEFEEPATQPPPPATPQLPPPDQLLTPPGDSEPPPEGTSDIPGTITVERFQVEGSTVFSEEELAKVTEPFTKRPISFSELLQARTAVTKLYTDNGYITSGAFIPAGRTIENGVVPIKVIEGKLEDIQIEGTKRLRRSYISSRLRRATRQPLNVDRLLEALQLLQLDPLIETLSAELSASAQPGVSLLSINIKEANSLHLQLSVDNQRSPSIGSIQGRAQLEQANLLGFGDAFRVSYGKTDGSDQVEVGYTFPINAKNGTVAVNFSQIWSNVVEEPFDLIDITGTSRDLTVTYRQPILRTPRKELALSFSAGRRESETTLLGFRFPFPESGADSEGRIRLHELRFAQDYVNRDQNAVLALRSEFALGLDVFDTTDNPITPDGLFFLWRGQGQWVRRLSQDTLLLLRTNLQFADRPLPSLAQFGLGGLDSVRGYRQDLLLVDDGVFGSAEVRLPILRVARRKGILHLVPFVDFGHGFNIGSGSRVARQIEGSNTLFAAGLGLRWQWTDQLTARVDWGVPFISVGSDSSGFDESRFFFSIVATPF